MSFIASIPFIRNFIVLIILASSANLAMCKTLGSLVEDEFYTGSNTNQLYYGEVNVIAYLESKANASKPTGYIGLDFELWINEKKVALVEQSFVDMATQRGQLNYLNLSLPNGKYPVAVFKRSMWGANKIAEFEVIVRNRKSLWIVLNTGESLEKGIYSLRNGYPSSVNGLTIVPKYNIFAEAYDHIKKSAEESALNFSNEEELEKQKIEERKRNLIALELKKKEEEERLIKEAADLEKERRAALIEQEAIRSKIEAESHAIEDDATCKSFGAKPGSQPYVLCRAKVAASRQEAIDRQRANIALEKKVDALRNKVIEQDNQRASELDAIERRRAQESEAMQQRYMAEQAQKEKAERSERSMRYFEAAARMLQPTGPFPSSQVPSQGASGVQC